MAETFGKTTKGATSSKLTKNYIGGSKYQSGSAGLLQSITAWIKGLGTAGQIKCAIYDADFNLLANGATEEKNFAADEDGWMTFNFPTAPSVSASTFYHLCFWANQDFDHYFDDGVMGDGFYKLTGYNSWPDPITGETSLAQQKSIYATYKEAPPKKKTLVQMVNI